MPTSTVSVKLEPLDLERLDAIMRGFHHSTKSDALRGLIRRARIQTRKTHTPPKRPPTPG